MDPQVRALEERVERLEAEVARLKGAQEPASHEPAFAFGPAPLPHDRPSPASPPGRVAVRAEEAEASLVGTWFARLGALAVLLGAGFAFKYAIDRGLIGPSARVAIGMAAGLAFLWWGEWARRRHWPGYAQAVTGGGLGLLYLSIWAGLQLYGLFGPAVAFGLLTAVAAAGVALALRHDSQPLASLAVVGGFANPYLVGIDAPTPAALTGYVVLLDLGVLALAGRRRWSVLDRLALMGTWVVAVTGIITDEPPILVSLTTFFLVFAALPFLRMVTGRAAIPADLALTFSNGILYLVTGLVVLFLGGLEQWQGSFALALAAAHLGLAALARKDRLLFPAMAGLAALFLAVAAALELEAPWITVAWSIEGVALIWAGSRGGYASLRGAGALVVGFAVLWAVFVEFSSGDGYRPDRLLLSGQSMAMVLHVAALALAGLVLGRPAGREWERLASNVAGAAANLTALAWLSFEAQAALDRAGGTEQALQFTYSTIWGLYAGALLAVGIVGRIRGARLLAVALLGATMVKMVVVDLWLLEPLLRTLAFVGLGAVLLAGSLLYHRFRDLVLEGRLEIRGS